MTKTIPAPPMPPHAVAETTDPRVSITWPNGWIDAWGYHRRVGSDGRSPFERVSKDLGQETWEPSSAMGQLPHKRAV